MRFKGGRKKLWAHKVILIGEIVLFLPLAKQNKSPKNVKKKKNNLRNMYLNVQKTQKNATIQHCWPKTV